MQRRSCFVRGFLKTGLFAGKVDVLCSGRMKVAGAVTNVANGDREQYGSGKCVQVLKAGKCNEEIIDFLCGCVIGDVDDGVFVFKQPAGYFYVWIRQLLFYCFVAGGDTGCRPSCFEQYVDG